MSRAPLLLRSSPALGTGSYGVLPTTRNSDDEEDETGIRGTLPRRTAGKGKHALRKSFTNDDGGEVHAIRAGAGLTRRRRKSTPGERSSQDAYDDGEDSAIVGGEHESGLESRFTGGFATASSVPLTKTTSRSSLSKSRAEANSDGSGDDDTPDRSLPVDDSQYAQVRASVPPTDNLTLSINTPRMWILSMLFAVFGSSTNLFFSLRYPSVSITPVIALLIVHPLGLLWDRCLKCDDDEEEVFVHGYLEGVTSEESWMRRWRLWFAQGRWNEKEHCCVFISSNVSFGFAFATDVRINSPGLLFYY